MENLNYEIETADKEKQEQRILAYALRVSSLVSQNELEEKGGNER